MKNQITGILLIAAVSLLSGCAGIATTQEVPSLFYADYTLGKQAYGPVGSKSGRACAVSYLGLFGRGDASVAAAAANGGIKNVYSINKEVSHTLGIYGLYCTVVYGE